MKRTVKKFISVLLVAIMAICAVPLSGLVGFELPGTLAFAAFNTYKLKQLELEVDIPPEYSVITRDTPSTDSVFANLGTTKSALMNQFEKNSIYLNAISNTYNEEIVVTMEENIIDNFSSFSDTMLESIASSLVEEYSDFGAEITSYNIYKHSQAKFIKLYFKIQSESVFGIQYYTVYGGKAINITLRSYEDRGTYTEFYRQTRAIETIVNSVRFDQNPPTSKLEEDTSSFIYTDTDSGISFTIPANWEQKELNGDRKHLDAKFVSTKESDCVIIFGSTDMWEAMPSSEKNGYSRKDLDNSLFTKSDIAEMYGTTEDKISVVSYNGVQYYKGEMTKSLDESGFNLSITTTQLTYINDGWMYMFQFGGTDGHSLYSDFESLVSSIKYPSALDSSNEASTNQKNILNAAIVFGVIILLAVGTITLFIMLRRKKRLRQNTSKQEITDVYTANLLCRNCNHQLPPDSEFCHMCGAKVTKEDV